jgi:hypothetical protein
MSHQWYRFRPSPVGHDYADKTHVHNSFSDRLDGREEPINEPSTLNDHLLLSSPTATGDKEFVGVLKVVVVACDFGCDDFPRWQRRSIVDGNDADQVLGITDDDWCESLAVLDCRAHPADDASLSLAELDRVGRILGKHNELSEVDRMGALAAACAAALSGHLPSETGEHRKNRRPPHCWQASATDPMVVHREHRHSRLCPTRS